MVGIIGPGESAKPENIELAYVIGGIVAKLNFILLTGGRNCGVMEAAMKGARENNGITVGIIPDDHKNRMSSFVDIPIVTGMGNARNNIIVLTSDLIIVIGNGAGTLSEIALALKAGKKLLIDNRAQETFDYLKRYENSCVIPFDPVKINEIERLIIKYI